MRNEIADSSRALAFSSAPWVYAFGPFRLDSTRGLLTFGTEVVPLPERLLTILLALIRANGMIVTREELYSLIWPDGGIAEYNLSQHVYMLRRTLGERANDRLYISTVHNKGFRFVAPISVVNPTEPKDEAQPRQPASPDLSPGMLDVFRHYSAGCQVLMRGRSANLLAAAEQFELALKSNDEYVPALIGSARAYLSLARNCYLPGTQAHPNAKLAIIHALQLDPMSAAAHAILSNIILCADWNWRDAKREIDSAVRLNPENAVVRSSLMWLYEWNGQPKKALVEVQNAIAQEPSLPVLQVVLGRLLVACEQYADAISHLTHLVEESPDYAVRARYHRAQAYLLSGHPRAALSDLLLVPHDHAEDLAWRLPLLGRAYAGVGEHQMAEQVYESLLTSARTEYVAFTNLIPLALALNKRSDAIRHLDEALSRREASLPLLRHWRGIDPIRKSEAFKALLEAIARNATLEEAGEDSPE